jgi:hypothetical protein
MFVGKELVRVVPPSGVSFRRQGTDTNSQKVAISGQMATEKSGTFLADNHDELPRGALEHKANTSQQARMMLIRNLASQNRRKETMKNTLTRWMSIGVLATALSAAASAQAPRSGGSSEDSTPDPSASTEQVLQQAQQLHQDDQQLKQENQKLQQQIQQQNQQRQQEIQRQDRQWNHSLLGIYG